MVKPKMTPEKIYEKIINQSSDKELIDFAEKVIKHQIEAGFMFLEEKEKNGQGNEKGNTG